MEAIIAWTFMWTPSRQSYRLPAAAPSPLAPPPVPPATLHTPPLSAVPAPPASTRMQVLALVSSSQRSLLSVAQAGMIAHGEGKGVQGRQPVAAPDARVLQQGRGDACGYQLRLAVAMPEAQGHFILLLIVLINLLIIRIHT
eukprot:CAMPEP_0179460498 /NCGR_PEP_ID=MMETSP0799-20121207/43525_1 /TAXON_ID=46947 /ORGANISM="Geminigera cryophila, Strain CCMP2564" /LENGTH=141 /DNA_ID=CAMNT_0021262763 /DNA_START=429 /DNA_END=855 /DNA_ORIENTATION=-